MLQSIIIWLFGLPGVLLSLTLSVIGIARSKIAFCIAGAILILPFSFYLVGSPSFFRVIGLLLPIFQFGVALAVREKRTRLAWVLLLPLVGITVWLLFNII